jgi:hypothetical protein
MSAETPPAIRSESPELINRRSSEHAGPRSVEAGPSSPSPRLNRLHLTTSRASETDNALVEKAINAQRRKSSLLPGIHLHHPGQTHKNKEGKRKDSIGSGSYDGTINGSPEVIRRNSMENRDRGHEGGEEEALPPIPIREKIVMWKDSNIVGEDPVRWTGFDEEPDPNLEYVWEREYLEI